MELTEALRTTGAVRRFTSEPVEDATLAAILDTARFAPSGGNRQPWRVAVVRDAARRRAIADVTRPVWDEYVTASRQGQVPFNVVDYEPPGEVEPTTPNELLERIEDVPVVLAVAADLSKVAMMDVVLRRPTVVGGASIYPFCWSILLAARAHGLGGVMTTFTSRVEPQVREVLALPPTWALVATIFLGVPEHQPTKLRRDALDAFTTVDRFDGPAFTAVAR
jgi:nitroreductase